MTALAPFVPADWDGIALVVFDVDGTLYDQRALRLRMAFDLAIDALRRRELRVLRVIRHYREIREGMGPSDTADFEPELLARTARASGTSEAAVAAIVQEWIEARPLRHLPGLRYAGLEALFAGLRRHGKRIGVFSDYPAADKLAALGLAADLTACAPDPAVRALKPNPRGLARLMTEAGTDPRSTLMIGDRPERDGLAAEALGVRCLIRSSRPTSPWQGFRDYGEALFGPVLAP